VSLYVWASPNGVEHLVNDRGLCRTCGFSHSGETLLLYGKCGGCGRWGGCEEKATNNGKDDELMCSRCDTDPRVRR
jgi:hypothetical protein